MFSRDVEPTTAASVAAAAPAVASAADLAQYANADDKSIINAKADVNQLVPFKYKWTWDKYLVGRATRWGDAESEQAARNQAVGELERNRPCKVRR